MFYGGKECIDTNDFNRSMENPDDPDNAEYLFRTIPNSMAHRAKYFFMPVEDEENEVDEPQQKKRRSMIFNFECRLCKKIVSTNAAKSYIFVSHLKSLHIDTYNIIVAKVAHIKQNDIIKEKTKLKFLQDCAELIGINGRPFALLYDSGMQKMIQHRTDELMKLNCGINLRDPNLTVIKSYMVRLADKVKKSITEEVRGKHLSLMLDIATRHTRSILGISIQYREGKNLKIVTIGMKHIHSAHTAINIKSVLLACLSEYQINISQVSSVTSDNGSNMVAIAMIRLLREGEIENSGEEIVIDDENEDSGGTSSAMNQYEYCADDDLEHVRKFK